MWQHVCDLPRQIRYNHNLAKSVPFYITFPASNNGIKEKLRLLIAEDNEFDWSSLIRIRFLIC